MAFKKLKLECVVEFPNTQIKARIKRFDDKVFNATSKNFEDLGNTDEGSLIPLSIGVGLERLITSANIDINPAQFPDGEYSVYLYDNSFSDGPKLFNAFKVNIVNGTPEIQKVPSTTDIAIRLMEVKIGDTTLRNCLNNIQRDVKAILAKLK